MDFSLSVEHQMVRDSARDYLAAHSDSAAVRRVTEAGPAHDEALWHAIAGELGWCGIALPEAVGGAGLGAPGLVLLQEQLGQRLACVPFWSSACVAAPWLQGSVGHSGPWLERLATGECRAAAVLPDDGGWHYDGVPITARAGADCFVLSGSAAHVADAAGADWLLVPTRLDDGAPALFLLEPAALAQDARFALAPLDTLDRTRPLASLRLDGLALAASACLARGDAAAQGLAQAWWHGKLMLAAEQLGAAQQCLDLTVAYASERIQFGRAIGSFQAVKHRCAQMMVLVEAARSAVYGAAQAWEAAGMPDARLEICAAAIAADDALRFCAQEAIQLHGGVGFTWEYDPQLYFKRAQAAGQWLGGAGAALAYIAANGPQAWRTA
ncbi:acyl-CoA dehydrogenase family protein [Cupriavidus taiwanensis]|uniref:acyl-CoA dehydrogenase family protein n=1 Tax=Cupriavidus taiwanensis TaxID=164546 RepID=UPI000E102936|nr:acyl-CoA dehydrogenase family protein [Cupriavidus taiwanensis]SOY72314.1 putative acyl-CoA dehydrogenase [Cupriavidus taiwanensis]SOY72403.1 putative acyl-CoA dehydrogenase [Cupriavidus taiwanensis]SOY95971.1 putative acyl-CoA dehydrogenase [Cupriavidus taiwanensis]SOZ75094.1 putative acyl-CoA dehydrogenase [Cupriavidus taiwanensis]SOZ88675.1 putative acyl-CoA dehydrogenase [Cupriavidus taiwanensis]